MYVMIQVLLLSAVIVVLAAELLVELAAGIRRGRWPQLVAALSIGLAMVLLIVMTP